MNIWLDCVTIIIALSIMFFLDVKINFVFSFSFYILTVYFFFGRLRQLTRVRSQALAEVQGFLHERVQGMSVIKKFRNRR